MGLFKAPIVGKNVAFFESSQSQDLAKRIHLELLTWGSWQRSCVFFFLATVPGIEILSHQIGHFLKNDQDLHHKPPKNTTNPLKKTLCFKVFEGHKGYDHPSPRPTFQRPIMDLFGKVLQGFIQQCQAGLSEHESSHLEALLVFRAKHLLSCLGRHGWWLF